MITLQRLKDVVTALWK